MKGVFVILDGVADQPCKSLGQLTPLQAARTPNLDEIAKKSKIEHCYTVKQGIAPESSSAIVSLFGQDPTYAPRGPLEAQGAGIKFKKGDLVLRCNFATIDDLETGHILDSRAGRTLSTREAQILAKAINEQVKLPFPFTFYPTIQHRGILVIRGGFSANISNADPFYGVGMINPATLTGPVKMKFAHPLDDDEESNLAANLINSFIRHSHAVLDKHPVNIDRARKGLFAANVLLCRDAGNEPVKFKKLRGRWRALCGMPLEIGIASALGMELYRFDYPRLDGMDVYSALYEGLEISITNAIRMLKKFKKKTDYFYIHIKETDIPGHDNKPHDKVKMLEIIDAKLFSFLKHYVQDARLVVTADHTTASRMKAHTDDPVPVLIYPSHQAENFAKKYSEEEGLKGKKINARKIIEQFILSK